MTHDHAGNLTADGLFQYQYDAWNRLTGVWYDDGNLGQAAERVARYGYDGFFRRITKEVTNQGEGVIYHSDDDDAVGIQAGDRYEHYFYSAWRLVETTNHVNGLISGVYDYAVSYVLNQFVYGTQYIDEPVRYDRNLQPSAQNRTCIGTGGEDLDASYFYHQDANYRVVALTDEDGYVVERTTYTAYGEPTVFGGVDSGVAAELGNALLVSTAGNPFLHQGLFRDRESLSYQNRFRQYDSRSGRFLQRDPLGYIDGMSLYQCVGSAPTHTIDPIGLQGKDPGARSHDLPGGYKARIDPNPHPHVHVYDPNGREVAKLDQNGAYERAHRGQALKRPSELPKPVRNRVGRIIRRFVRSILSTGTAVILVLEMTPEANAAEISWEDQVCIGIRKCGFEPMYDDDGNFIGYGCPSDTHIVCRDDSGILKCVPK